MQVQSNTAFGVRLQNLSPLLTELTSKVKVYNDKERKLSRRPIRNVKTTGETNPNGLWHSYNAIERRRRLFDKYSLNENDRAIRRLRNSKPFSCSDVFEIRTPRLPKAMPSGTSKKVREILDNRGKTVAVRLRDTDSDGREIIYSLGGWD